MKLIEKLFFEGVWECYFRDIQSVSLLDKKAVADNWNKIIVPRRYWCADPFIVNDEKDNYVFCELMDRKISRGLLGIGKLSVNGETKITILADLGCHTSYPNIFTVNGEWFMIPETVDRKSIELYKAKAFPYTWEKVATILNGINAVDTTVFFMNEKMFLFIYDENGVNNKLSIGELDLNTYTVKNIKKVMQYTSKVGRPGGNIVYKDGQMLRPTQYGVNHYGEALIFKNFQYNPENGEYHEEDVMEMRPADIMPEYIAKNFNGLHTYNQVGKYEIIDVHRKNFFIERPLVSLLKKLRIGGYRYYVREK